MICMPVPLMRLPIFCCLWRKVKERQHNCCIALKLISATLRKAKVLPRRAKAALLPVSYLVVPKLLGKLAKYLLALLAAEIFFETAQGEADYVAVVQFRS